MIPSSPISWTDGAAQQSQRRGRRPRRRRPEGDIVPLGPAAAGGTSQAGQDRPPRPSQILILNSDNGCNRLGPNASVERPLLLIATMATACNGRNRGCLSNQ